jgi:hypothetical protein
MVKARGILFRFGEKSVFGDWVNRESFLRVLNSKYFQDKLKRNVVLGCLTHQIRDEALADEKSQVPLADWLLAKRAISNKLTNLWVEGDVCYYELVVMDNEEGLQVQELMVKEQVDLLPSVVFSVKDPNSKEMEILDILAVDLTTDPAFNTTLEVIAHDA